MSTSDLSAAIRVAWAAYAHAVTYWYVAGAVVMALVIAVSLMRQRRSRATMTPLEIAKAASRAAAAETRRVTRPSLRGTGSGDSHGDSRWDGHIGSSSSLD